MSNGRFYKNGCSMGTETRDSGGSENPFHNRIGNLRREDIYTG